MGKMSAHAAALRRTRVLGGHLAVNATAGGKTYSADEVAKHNTAKDCWVIVNGEVLNVTDFLADHPGGNKAILLFAGKDASEEFNMLHKKEVVHKYLDADTQIL